MDLGRRGLRARARGGRRRATARSRSRSTATSTASSAARPRGCSAGCSPTTGPPDLILLETLSVLPAVARSHGRGAARHRAAGVALVPALPARPVRRLRAALGRARRATRSAAPRAGSSRWAWPRCWSTASRPTTSRDGLLPARLRRPAARRVPEPRLLHRPRLALRPGRRRRRVRRAGAALARGGRADHRRLLRRAARAHRGGARAARGHRGPATAARSPSRPRRRRRDPPRRGPTRAGARCTRCRSRSSTSSRASSRPRRRASWPGATCSTRGSAPASAASTSAAAPASSASSSRSTAPRTCTRSTSTSAPSRNTLANAFRNGVGDRDDRGDRRHLPVGAGGALRGRSSRALAQRPVDPCQSGRRSPADRLLGAHAARPADREARPTRSRRRASRTSCSSRSSRSAARPRCSPPAGLEARVVDYARVRRRPTRGDRAQIGRVEELSDADHHASATRRARRLPAGDPPRHS